MTRKASQTRTLKSHHQPITNPWREGFKAVFLVLSDDVMGLGDARFFLAGLGG